MYTAHFCSGIPQSLTIIKKYVTETQNCGDVKWMIKKQSAPLIKVKAFIVFMLM